MFLFSDTSLYMLFLCKPSVTERDLSFLWHVSYIGITCIRKCHRKKKNGSVTVTLPLHCESSSNCSMAGCHSLWTLQSYKAEISI